MINFPDKRDLPICLQPDKAGPGWREPLDVRDLTTRLETEGVTDAVALSEFGFESTWSMAASWLPKLRDVRSAIAHEVKPGSGWREYVRGISFALPLLCSCVSILLLGFSLWGGNLTAGEASAVGLGTVSSFLLSAGMIQMMARRGLFFAGTKQFARCEQVTWWWMRLGMLAILGATLVLTAVSLYWDVLPGRLTFVAAAFCASLGLFWMATGALHFLNRAFMIVWVTLAGIALVTLLHFVLRWPLLDAQLAAIVASGAAALIACRRTLRAQLELSPPNPAPFSLLRDVIFLWPYFAYGILYYLLLFADRIMAWTAHTLATAFAIQFRGDYEAALTIGLFAFIVQVGWVQQSTTAFYHKLAEAQRCFSIDTVLAFRLAMIHFYWGRLIWFVPIAIAASAVSVFASTWLASGGIPRVALWSLAGFPFLVVGLWNVSLLFGLSSAPKAAAAAALSCAVDISAGYLASRLGSYEDAVIGFTLGSIVFAVLSGFWCLRAFRRLDYLYFAATS